MNNLKSSLLWKAREADLMGDYDLARKLRDEWCEKNKTTCEVCGKQTYYGYHDKEECDEEIVRSVMGG